MHHAAAKIIAAEHKPHLLVDEHNPAIPEALIVRRKEGGPGFSIHLPTAPPPLPDVEPPTEEDVQAAEEAALKSCLDQADKMLPEG